MKEGRVTTRLDPAANEVKLPLISIGSVIPYKDFSPWSFRVQLIVSKAMGPVLSQVKALKGVHSIAVIHDTANNATAAEQEAVAYFMPRIAPDTVPSEPGDFWRTFGNIAAESG